jgi:hypothetical protein
LWIYQAATAWIVAFFTIHWSDLGYFKIDWVQPCLCVVELGYHRRLDIQNIYVPSVGQIRVDILVYGTGLDYDPTYAGIGSAIIEIGPGSTNTISVPEKPSIPSWIKNNAEWWAAGQIDDDSFIQGIQFLIKEGIMRIQS